MFTVTVVVRNEHDEVETIDQASGNTARTAQAAGYALARSYENEGFDTTVGRARAA